MQTDEAQPNEQPQSQPEKPKRKRGRPVLIEGGRKVTIFISDEDVTWLDELKESKNLKNRSEVIRGIIQMVRRMGIR